VVFLREKKREKKEKNKKGTNLEEGLDRELDGFAGVEVLGVVLLQELTDSLGASANGVCLQKRERKRGRKGSAREHQSGWVGKIPSS